MIMNSWVMFIAERFPELILRTGEHLLLTGVSTGFAITAGIPLGILASKVQWLRSILTGGIGILQTIPSLAMLAILLTLLNKIGMIPAIIALILYALLPIVRNTITGLEGISPEIREAAVGCGMTPFQRLWIVELPLSFPVMIAGIRTAAVVGVGIATLSAFIGAGGLGQFINRGLALSNTPLILLGAIPAAILALIVDGGIAIFQWGVCDAKKKMRMFGRKQSMHILRSLALSIPVLFLVMGYILYGYGKNYNQISSDTSLQSSSPKRGIVHIGTKNFTEQIILGELMACIIEAQTDLKVVRHFNLGGTMICHQALINGEIDIYAEYTGTALSAILKKKPIGDSDKTYEIVSREYQKRFDVEWLLPFGFNNTYTITIRKKDALSQHIATISDLAQISSDFRAGFTAEFSERVDGYPGLRDMYKLLFKDIRDLDPSIMYEAIAKHEVDVICAFATDGRIEAYNLIPLKDDKAFFPPYYAAPVMRTDVIRKYPEVKQALICLNETLNDTVMQKLNFEVDENKKPPKEVVKDFLKQSRLIK